MMIDAVIFDFDGLILETEEAVFLSFQEIYQEHGLDLSFEKWAVNIGTADVIFDPFLDLQVQVDIPLAADLPERRQQRELELILAQPIMPGALEYLQAARRLGLKIGLASSSPSEWVIGHLTRLGLLDYFDCIRVSDHVPRTKPDPAVYLAALQCLGVQPERVVSFEDSPNGILAARRAGVFCVAVPSVVTRHLPVDHANMRLESLTDMPLEQLLQQIEKRLNGRIAD